MQSLLRLARRAGGRRLTSARRPRRPIVSTASGRHFAQHRFLSTLFNVAPVRGAAIRRASIRGPEGYGRPLAANFSTDGSPDGSGSAGDKADEAAASDAGSDGGVTGGSSELETDTDGDVSAAKESEWNRTGGSDDIVMDGDDNEESKAHVEDMKPREVIEELNRNIVGQMDAKRAVAIALRNRWRRQQLPEHMRREIVPRNMLMIGPTGCGKTEIARRLSQLMDAPFVKVEATKFTEVGFHGRDVDTIIRDLLENGIALTKKTRRKRLKEQVTQTVETKILEALMGRESVKSNEHISYLKFLRDGKLDDQKVDIHVPVKQRDIGPGGFAIDPSTLQGGSLDALVGRVTKAMTGPKTVKRNLKIKEARALLEEAEMEELLEADDVVAEAIRNVEQNGIVFIDEIDKICTPSGEARFSGDASSEGVQRDLLPLVEGSSCSTKHGNVNTDYILFIASGAFHHCKPSDLLPELQGRLPIRVNLKGLDVNDLYKILTEPEANLIEQHKCLLAAEGVELVIADNAIKRIAELAAEANKNVENIGARRLYTVMERIMEEYSFDAADMDDGSVIEVTAEDVEKRLGDLMKQQDLQKFIL